LRVDHGTLLVRNGFTHYPQEQEEIRFFPGDPNLPDRIVVLDSSGSLTLDALAWLSDQQITLVQLNWRGEINVIGGVTGHSAKRNLVEAQLAAQHGTRRIKIARWLISDKIAASIDTLQKTLPKSDEREFVEGHLENCLKKISRIVDTAPLARLSGIEGTAAAVYFRLWHGLPLRWSNVKRKPIPESWQRIGPRKMGWRDNSRNARHPVNAMLNYGYGMLASQVRIQTVAAGLDPSIGIMHGNKDNRIPLVYDLMEPLRPVVDQAIFEFALEHTFSPGDFAFNRWGGCRLNPQMAKVVASRLTAISDNRVINTFLKQLR